MAAVPEEFEQDFEQAYRAHYPLLHRRSRRFFPAEEAEDAVQETFLRAWTHHRGKNPGVPWMMTVLRNLAIDRSRRKHAEPVGDIEQLDRPTEETTADQVISLEERRALHRAMQGLTPAQQEALKLREWHGLSHKEVAERLGTTVGGVESLLVRGKRRLRSALEGAMAMLMWPASSLWRRFRHLPAGSAEAAAQAAPAASGITVTMAQLATAAAVLVAGVASGPRGQGPDGTTPEPIGSRAAITFDGSTTHDSRMPGAAGSPADTTGAAASGGSALMPGSAGSDTTTGSESHAPGDGDLAGGSEGGPIVSPPSGGGGTPGSPPVEPSKDGEQGEVPNQDPPNGGETGEVPDPVVDLNPGIGAPTPATNG